MKIQIVSDLHLEFPENREWLENNPLLPKGDVLLIAGDTIPDKYKKKARKFYEKISDEFPFIISTMGNHEFYKGTIDYAYPTYKSYISENHIRLNNKTYILDDVKFIVSILWTHVPAKRQDFISERMNDYRLIFHKDQHGDKYPLMVFETNMYHDLSLDYIQEELDKPFEGKIVVMTHHIPCFECIKDIPDPDNRKNGYASDLSGLILSHPEIKYWICGHAHDFNITQIGETMVVRNPLGYVFEGQQENFRRDFTVEV